MDARTQTGAAGAATGSPTLDARMGALHVQADTVSRSVFDIVAMLAERESALKEQKSALESETGKQEAALQALHDRLRREMASERQALDVEKAFVAAASSSPLVVLSVGGTKFTARRDTLARAPGFFGALFSGRHTVPAQEDGSYFIERDPTHFSLILRWLSDGRDNFSALPRATKIALAEEADYYALDDLLTAINGTDHLRALSEGDAAIRREENLRRAAFARCESLVRAASIAQAAATPLPEAPRDDLDDDAPMPSFSVGAAGSGGRSRGGSRRPGREPVTPVKAAARPFLTPLTSLRLSATRRRDEASEWAERVREACNHIHNGFYDFRDVLAIAASTGPMAGCVRLDMVDRRLDMVDRPNVPQWIGAVGQLLPFRRVTHSPAGYPLLFEQFAAHHNELEPSQCVLVRTLDEWKLAFSRHNPDILDRLGSVSCPARCKWVIAGGSVLRALLRRPPAAAAFDDTDVDIFIVAEEAADATRLAESIWCALAADGEEWVLSRGQYVINMIRSGGELASAAQPPVQIVLRLYESPSEVLHGFDVDPCAVAFDGEGLHALPRAIEALRTGYGVLNPLHAWPRAHVRAASGQVCRARLRRRRARTAVASRRSQGGQCRAGGPEGALALAAPRCGALTGAAPAQSAQHAAAVTQARLRPRALLLQLWGPHTLSRAADAVPRRSSPHQHQLGQLHDGPGRRDCKRARRVGVVARGPVPPAGKRGGDERRRARRALGNHPRRGPRESPHPARA